MTVPASPSTEYDLRGASDQMYAGRTRPLRLLLIGLAIVFTVGSIIALVRGGPSGTALALVGVSIGFLAFVPVAFRYLLVRGPVTLRLAPGRVELVEANGRIRTIPRAGRVLRVELTDLARSRVMGRPAAWGGGTWLLQVNGGSLVALTPEALSALRDFLPSVGLHVVYEGQYRGLAGSRVWKFAS